MGHDWNKIEADIVPDLRTDMHLEELHSMVDTLRGVMEPVLEGLRIMLKFLQGKEELLYKLVKKLIDEIRGFLDGLINGTGIYALVVPVPRRMLNSEYTVDTDVAAKYVKHPVMDQYASYFKNYKLETFLDRSAKQSGGNAGFYRTVWESLRDEGDINRPLFEKDTRLRGLVVLAGWTGIDDIGYALGDLFNAFALWPGMPLWPKFPRPRELTARTTNLNRKVVTKDGIQNIHSHFNVMLNWNTHGIPVYNIPDLPGGELVVERYMIIRGINTVTMLGCKHIGELFPGKYTVGTKVGGVEVIFEGAYKNALNIHMDKDIELDEGGTVYYAVAWKMKDMEYNFLSNIATCTPVPNTGNSEAPDWIRTPGLGQLIPPLGDAIGGLSSTLDILLERFKPASSAALGYIDAVERQLDMYAEYIDRIILALERLTLQLSFPRFAGLYARDFKVQGTSAFEADLAVSLSEDDAPPYHEGTEYVMGLILLMATKTKVDETIFDTLLDLLGIDGGSGNGNGSKRVDGNGCGLSSIGDTVSLIKDEIAKVKDVGTSICSLGSDSGDAGSDTKTKLFNASMELKG